MNRPLSFMPQAWDDYLYWQTQDKRTLRRINQLLQDIQRDSTHGVGKPEPLKGDLAGYWSRRVDAVTRIVYKPENDAIVILSCRYHYGKE